jgi:hypothetical protein
MKTTLLLATMLGALGLLAACGPGGGTYCQSGSKYGTQCYSQMDVSNPPGQRPDPAPAGSGERR